MANPVLSQKKPTGAKVLVAYHPSEEEFLKLLLTELNALMRKGVMSDLSVVDITAPSTGFQASNYFDLYVLLISPQFVANPDIALPIVQNAELAYQNRKTELVNILARPLLTGAVSPPLADFLLNFPPHTFMGGAALDQVKDPPAEITFLVTSWETILRESRLDAVRRRIKQLSMSKAQTQLDLTNLALTELPTELLDIADRLERLNLDNNRLEALPDWIGQLSQLRYLSLPNNQLWQLPDTLDQLVNLEHIDLSNNRFSQFPLMVCRLSQLKELYICRNYIRQLPSDIVQLQQLEVLFIGNSTYDKEQRVVVEYSSDTRSNLSTTTHNALTDLPLELAQLPQLRYLDLTGLQLTQLPPVVLGIRTLQYLFLSRNLFTELAIPPDTLLGLKALDLGYNQISQLLPAIENIPQLEALYIDNNRIEQLPPDMVYLMPNLGELWLYGNPIGNVPRELFDRDLQNVAAEVYSYLRSLREADAEVFLYEAKMVVVGKGSVGKTTLIKKMTRPDYHLQAEASTQGIDVQHAWTQYNSYLPQGAAPFKWNIWDFGGQDKYEATHQFFITPRSLYLFITEARKESNLLDFDFWLNTIRILSNDAPVIVVLSKIDERDKDIPAFYKQRFQNIVEVVKTSCADGYEHTIAYLVALIKQTAARLPQAQYTLSNKWLDVRRHLQQDKRDYISYREYLEICDNYGLDQQRADFVSQYLHDLGVIIHHQKDRRLKHTVIIKPDWGVDGVYAVLDNPKIIAQRGVFTDDNLDDIWGDLRYAEKQNELLALMQKFELCVALDDQKTYIATELLSLDPPDTLRWQGDSPFEFEYTAIDAVAINSAAGYVEYRYPFMPAGMLMRFIVKSRLFMEGNVFWRYGTLLRYGTDTQALVVEDYQRRKISITVKGSEKGTLLYMIRQFMDEIHLSFGKLEREEWLPCICQQCRSHTQKAFYKLNDLLRFQEKGKITKECPESADDVNIDLIMNSIANNATAKPNATDGQGSAIAKTAKLLMLLYGTADAARAERLIKLLRPLQEKGKIAICDNQQVEAGKNRMQEIQIRLQNAHFALPLISPDLDLSDTEEDTLWRRQERGELRVIPILLRTCLFDDTAFAKLTPLPDTRQFVESAPDKDTAYAHIAQAIAQLVDK